MDINHRQTKQWGISMTDTTSYSFILFGATISFTSSGVVSGIGLLIGIAGIIIGLQRNGEMRRARLESKRANDLKERELDAKAKDSETS